METTVVSLSVHTRNLLQQQKHHIETCSIFRVMHHAACVDECESARRNMADDEYACRIRNPVRNLSTPR